MLSGGSAANSTVGSGGTLIVLPGGSATGPSFASGSFDLDGAGVALVSSDAVISAVTGTLSGATVGGGDFAIVMAGGTLAGGTVTSGGNATDTVGGTVSGTVVSSGGQITVSSGGVALSTSAVSAGEITVSADGETVSAALFGTATGGQRVPATRRRDGVGRRLGVARDERLFGRAAHHPLWRRRQIRAIVLRAAARRSSPSAVP